jgi:hypothetical protein
MQFNPRKPYFKYELAHFYNVDVDTLIRWFEPFIGKLTAAGYQKNQKKLTPRQQEIIVAHLGEP